MIILSDEQHRVYNQIADHIVSPKKDSFTFHGLAGTGKTTVMAAIMDAFPEARMGAFTGKAASVLTAKTGRMASTLHSLLLKPEAVSYMEETMVTDPETGRSEIKQIMRTRMEWTDQPQIGFGDVLLVDECSMVNGWLGQKIVDTGATIVACGDPGQLPPVQGDPFFNESDALLTEIHRQALGNPIIRQAHRVRQGRRYEADGPEFQISGDRRDDRIFTADMVLCWTNKTRIFLNDMIRSRRGFTGHPKAGEPVMCLKNDREIGIFNGGVYALAQDYTRPSDPLVIIIDDVPTRVPQGFFIEGERADKDYGTPFCFAYAMTVHKAQGSQGDNVVILDEVRSFANTQAERVAEISKWTYTAITRAAKTVVMIR